MLQNTAEKFLVLIQHPEKARYVIPEPARKAGLTGSILMDLASENAVEIEEGRLIPKSTGTDLPFAHKHILEQIQMSTKNKKVKAWISKFTRRSGKYQKEILAGLENRGIIKMEHKKFLFIKYYKTRLINPSIREDLINDIRESIFGNAEIGNEESKILGLVEACKLYKIICKDRKEVKQCRAKLKEIMKSDAISQGVDKVIKEMHAAIAGAVTAAVVGAAAASSR